MGYDGDAISETEWYFAEFEEDNDEENYCDEDDFLPSELK